MMGRVLSLLIATSSTIYVSEYIPTTFIGITSNCEPIVICIMSYFFLGEVLDPFIKVFVLIAFTGCMIIANGSTTNYSTIAIHK